MPNIQQFLDFHTRIEHYLDAFKLEPEIFDNMSPHALWIKAAELAQQDMFVEAQMNKLNKALKSKHRFRKAFIYPLKNIKAEII